MREEYRLETSEERVAFALVQFLKPENILVKRDCLTNVAYLNRDVIAPVHLDTHGATNGT